MGLLRGLDVVGALEELDAGGAEVRVVVEEEGGGEVRLVEAAGGFGEADGGEVEQGERGEDGEVVEVGVEASDEAGGGEQVGVGLGGVGFEVRCEAGRFPVVFDDGCEAVDAQQREGEAGGEERVDEACGGGEERPAFACDGGAAEGEARDVAEGLDWFCCGELFAQGGDVARGCAAMRLRLRRGSSVRRVRRWRRCLRW